MSEQWLMDRVPGFRELPVRDRKAIGSFTFLWSLFEARLLGNFATAKKLQTTVDEWHLAGRLEAELYDDDLSYFRERYFANGELTHHFENLNLRPADQPDLVRQVIDGTNGDPRHRVLALLMIVWRFRNNLFHGAKWAYGLRGQFRNFTHANAILMRILDRHGQMA